MAGFDVREKGSGNAGTTNVLRAVGIFLVIIGLLAIISPIQKIASFVPVLGSIFNGVTTFIAIILGLALSLIDIACAWIFYRPVLGICLLVVAVGLIILCVVLKKKKKAPAVQQSAPVQQQIEQQTNDNQNQ